MTTQTGAPTLQFTIHKLISVESGPDDGAANIVDPGETFRMQLHFNGSGQMWENLENLRLHYHVRFYADGLGVPDELDLGEVFGNLVPGGPPGPDYIAERAMSITNEGVYKCAASVYFFTAGHGPFAGLLGFTDELAMMVHAHEQ